MMELINELINDVSPVYFYLSILLTMASAYSFSAIQFGQMMDTHHLQIRKNHNERYRLLPIQELFGMCDEIFQWVIKKANRIAAPDDDTGHSSFSLRAMDLIQRGGKICTIILYSLFLRNTVLLV
ncbi:MULTISPECIES: hypothetical protein [Clostridia]|uniref:hypothetical protein n=1 Tax=Clostridia TaxID=186801 RepID=UPI000EA0DD3A|nr:MULTISPECIES: hypothetical protein [Clostridia]NBJ67908.1 hypothetical protein [Roseburia sp. 1XD42-34]RKI82356.1 hypothetical protein D7V87_00240 [Clostridium sp. 1xD42-85]